MGVYQYTMRKDVREVSGMKIGRFEFAYKLGRDWQPGGQTDEWKNGKFVKNRIICMMEGKAEKARAELRDVQYAVICENFNEASEYELPVYEIGNTMYQFTEELDPKRLVGTLKKVARKLVFVPKMKEY
jgi:hypothetical protein